VYIDDLIKELRQSGYGIYYLGREFVGSVAYVVFGGHGSSHFSLMLNETTIPSVEKVKYLGIFINCKTKHQLY